MIVEYVRIEHMNLRHKKLAVSILTVTLVAGAWICPYEASAARPKAKSKANAEDVLRQARAAFNEYDFDSAAELLDEYEELMSRKKGREAPEEIELLRERIDLGSNMMTRVERIAVIDSFTVDSAAMTDAIRLSAAAGSIRQASAEAATKVNGTVYMTENGRRRLWGMPGAGGEGSRLVQSVLLSDGSWEQPEELDENLNLGGNAAYPFLMNDGVTLYYASDGEGSLGGYDIFMARNNGDGYLTPQNVGMPYNSPANDYLMAIDETTGAGWWVTDRNAPKGRLTVYMFVPEDVRRNYPADTPGLTSLARLDDITATQAADADYSSVRHAIARLNHQEAAKTEDFHFLMPDGKVYTSMNQLHSQYAVEAMGWYLEARKSLEDVLAALKDMRQRYAAGETSLSTQILEAEKKAERLRWRVRDTANAVISAES